MRRPYALVVLIVISCQRVLACFQFIVHVYVLCYATPVIDLLSVFIPSSLPHPHPQYYHRSLLMSGRTYAFTACLPLSSPRRLNRITSSHSRKKTPALRNCTFDTRLLRPPLHLIERTSHVLLRFLVALDVNNLQSHQRPQSHNSTIHDLPIDNLGISDESREIRQYPQRSGSVCTVRLREEDGVVYTDGRGCDVDVAVLADGVWYACI